MIALLVYCLKESFSWCWSREFAQFLEKGDLIWLNLNLLRPKHAFGPLRKKGESITGLKNPQLMKNNFRKIQMKVFFLGGGMMLKAKLSIPELCLETSLISRNQVKEYVPLIS